MQRDVVGRYAGSGRLSTGTRTQRHAIGDSVKRSPSKALTGVWERLFACVQLPTARLRRPCRTRHSTIPTHITGLNARLRTAVPCACRVLSRGQE
jgi:hypothetical protein